MMLKRNLNDVINDRCITKRQRGKSSISSDSRVKMETINVDFVIMHNNMYFMCTSLKMEVGRVRIDVRVSLKGERIFRKLRDGCVGMVSGMAPAD